MRGSRKTPIRRCLMAVAACAMLAATGCLWIDCHADSRGRCADIPDRPHECDGACHRCCADHHCPSCQVCTSDHECVDESLHECSDGLCHECCVGDDCMGDEFCDENYECELICLEEGLTCPQGRQECCHGLVCDLFFEECVPACVSDEECAGRHRYMYFADSLRCQPDGICDFEHCARDEHCRPGTVCYDGDCVGGVCYECASSCKVVPASAVTRTGMQVIFSATAFMPSGAMVPAAPFTWASDAAAAVAAVDDGVVTGGLESGTALITATVAGSHTSCQAGVANYGETADGARVVAVDELTGEPIEAVTVEIDGAAPVDTDVEGKALFPDLDLAADLATVTLSHAGYGYVSFVDAGSNDLIAYLGKTPDPTMAGGFRGQFDFSRIINEEGGLEVRIGLAGASIPGNLFNLDLDKLLGRMCITHIELDGTPEDLPLPCGMVHCMLENCFQREYRVTGVEGTRVAWGLGGKFSLPDLIEILVPAISGEIDMGALLSEVLPMFDSLHTGMKPNVEIAPIPRVNDEPAYENFPELDIVLKVPMEESVTVDVPELPSDGQGGWFFDGVFVLGGVLVRDAGFVPLGLSAGMDAPTVDEAADGRIDDVEMVLSDVAGRLPERSYRRVIVVLALNIAKLSDEENTDPQVVAGQVHLVDEFSGVLRLDPFMEPPAHAFDAAGRQLQIASLPAGADLVHMLFSSEAGSWQILHPVPAGFPRAFDLPAPPASGDRAEGVTVAALKLADGVSYKDLLAFNETNMNDLASLVTDFAIVHSGDSGGWSCDCSTGAGRSSLLGLAVVLFGLLLMRKRR